MRYEVWTQKPEYDSQHVLMMPAMSHDNEHELIQKGYQVCHVFDAESLERANELFQDWVKTVSMERFCDGHPAWECTDECRGLPPPAKHPIEARMADEKFGPPRKTPGTLPFDDDVRKAIEKHRNPVGGAMRESDAVYMTALEDENAELHEAAAAALGALGRGQKVIEALMPGLRHIAVQNYQEVNEAPIAMAQAVDALRDALGIQRPENVSETCGKTRPKE